MECNKVTFASTCLAYSLLVTSANAQTNQQAYSEEFYSSSPTIQKQQFSKQNQVQAEAQEGIITFSEFATNTYITDQYADKGIIFSGDTPFITSDSANPTTPVLSGYPRFNGAIEGHFVDPADPSRTLTVNTFALDAGYFDDLSSTAISWYNENGELLGKRFDSIYGIERFEISGENIASFRIAIETEERAGFAIDNVWFNQAQSLFNFEFETDKVYQKRGAKVSNTFTVYFRDLVAKSGGALEDICSQHSFIVQDSNQQLPGECSVDAAKKAFKVDFTLNNAPYVLKDASMSICLAEQCEVIKDLNNLSVYGTSFNVDQHGYAFKNGGWSDAMLADGGIACWVLGNCSLEQLEVHGTLLNVADGITPILPEHRRDEAYEIVGKYDGIDKSVRENRSFGGVCYGLATSAASNFNNSAQASAWGSSIVEGSSAQTITALYNDHWQYRETQTPKPLPKDVSQYVATNNNDIVQSMAQIAYYFVTQGAYSGSGANSGAGSASFSRFSNVEQLSSYYAKHFTNDKASPLVFYFTVKGGHAIVATQLIKYNNTTVLVTHDNNFPSSYSQLEFTGDALSTIPHFVVDFKKTGTVQSQYGDFVAYNPYANSGSMTRFASVTNDELQLHSTAQEAQNAFYLNASKEDVTEQNVKGNSNKAAITMNSLVHTQVVVQGARIVSVKNKQTDEPARLMPLSEQMAQDVSYVSRSLMSEKLYLSRASEFEVEIERYKQFPNARVFVKRTTESGTLEVINYEEITSDERFVIKVNSDVRAVIDNTIVEPTYSGETAVAVQAISYLQASSNGSDVQLTWTLPNLPNIAEVITVRSTDDFPVSPNDGLKICGEVANECNDTSASRDTIYYYSVFVITDDDQISTAESVVINTHQASLIGFVSANSHAVANVDLSLFTAEGMQVDLVNTTLSDLAGRFAFNGLPLGLYRLDVSGENVEAQSFDITIDSKQVMFDVVVDIVPSILINTENVVFNGENLRVSWDVAGLDQNDGLNVKLVHASGQLNLATELAAQAGQIIWPVDIAEQTVTVVVELANDETVNASAQVVVIQKNRAPVVNIAIPDQEAQSGLAYSFTFDAQTFTDADEGDELTYSATLEDGTELPSWLSFEADTRTFSGTPGDAHIGTVTIAVSVTDGEISQPVTEQFSINVVAAPVVEKPVEDSSDSDNDSGSLGWFSLILIVFAFTRRLVNR